MRSDVKRSDTRGATPRSVPRGFYCDRKILTITSNLERLLRYLRYQTEPRTHRVAAVWVNKANIEERNQQVALMRDV